MRKGTVKEVLAKIKYDPRENENDYYLIIEHRGDYGNVKKIPVNLIELVMDTFSLERLKYRITGY